VCELGDDALDSDGDGVADACDACEFGDDAEDADGDGVADACDMCGLGDDHLDEDVDGHPDACQTGCGCRAPGSSRRGGSSPILFAFVFFGALLLFARSRIARSGR
jgi:hypothetical protein